MNEIESPDSAEMTNIASERVNSERPMISLEVSEIDRPIYLRGGDQNDPNPGAGDCDS